MTRLPLVRRRLTTVGAGGGVGEESFLRSAPRAPAMVNAASADLTAWDGGATAAGRPAGGVGEMARPADSVEDADDPDPLLLLGSPSPPLAAGPALSWSIILLLFSPSPPFPSLDDTTTLLNLSPTFLPAAPAALPPAPTPALPLPPSISGNLPSAAGPPNERVAGEGVLSGRLMLLSGLSGGGGETCPAPSSRS